MGALLSHAASGALLWVSLLNLVDAGATPASKVISLAKAVTPELVLAWGNSQC